MMNAQQIDDLPKVETFYESIGGLEGYRKKILSLLAETKKEVEGSLHVPHCIDISEGPIALDEAIEALPFTAEIYPIGGAADRLSLRDPITGKSLPAAALSFCGKTLLAYLIEDLKAKEHLYFEKTGKKLEIPIALMVSEDPSHKETIEAIFEQNDWFGRDRSNICIFTQPLVPVMNKQGQWCYQKEGGLLQKPGGHGALWKCMEDQKVFDWLKAKGCRFGLIRQINNPIGGTDHGLLTLLGVGASQQKAFGFLSCPSLPGTSEGVDVLLEKDNQFCLTNIEYCDFVKYDVDTAKFPANTNLLFVDLEKVRQASRRLPIPGMLINAKEVETSEGPQEVVRLESTMQNISDAFVAPSEKKLETFILHAPRRKTISPIKQIGEAFDPAPNTPQKCLNDRLINARELLENYCDFSLPREQDFLFLYSPLLGPLYTRIGEKMRRGSIASGSEWQINASSVSIENLHVDGSLILEGEGLIDLRNVTVKNGGLVPGQELWRFPLKRKACCTITVEAGGEFIAEDIDLEGDLQLHVKAGEKVVYKQKEREKVFLAP